MAGVVEADTEAYSDQQIVKSIQSSKSDKVSDGDGMMRDLQNLSLFKLIGLIRAVGKYLLKSS